ncbi:MAG: hydrogenase expression/formation protein HypE [Anaerolineales bacterium]|nr:hydrogenase expression/formation protein HypE [Anaerolineales bacterium]
MSDLINPEAWSCPLPLRDYPNIVLGHGGGGKLSAELVQHLFLPAFGNPQLERLGDSAVLPVQRGRLAISTDSFVVQPLFFPGGNIGELAVNGTVNDVSMSGARPMVLTAGFILEEGLPLALLGRVVESMAAAARTAGVTIIAGDTKVVDKGHGDGLYINTSGLGLIPDGVDIGPDRARPGDVVILSGTMGDHGMAVMSVREGLEFETAITSDCAALNGLIGNILAVTSEIHVLRDPTRGGVAASLNEITAAAQVGIQLEERRLPVKGAVRSACELLGMDPLFVANEGKVLVIVPPEWAEPVLATMRRHPLGAEAAIIGQVVAEHPGTLVMQTGLGGKRVVAMQIGEQLPRIC